jgi:Ribonuclease G/E
VSCPTCKGSGVIKADATLAAEIFRAARAKVAAADEADGREIVVRVHPEVARYLEGDGQEGVERLAAALGRKVTVQAIANHADREGYEIRLRGGGGGDA